MVIVVKGADYSANNLGQITLPIIWDTDAQAYVNALSIANTLSDGKKRAINTFVKRLKSNSLWSKITRLYLPVFGRVDGSINIITPASLGAAFPTTGATYDANGITVTAAFQLPGTYNYTDIHTGAYCTTASTDNSATRLVFGNAFQWWTGRNLSGGQSGLISDSALTRDQMSNRSGSTGPIISTAKTSVPKTAVLIDTEYTSTAQAFNGPTAGNLFVGGAASTETTRIPKHAVGLITTGTYLTQTEMSTYGALQTTLMTALLAV